MTNVTLRKVVPAVLGPSGLEELRRQMIIFGTAINRLLDGKINATSSATLGSGTSTVITDSRVGGGSVVVLSPQDSTAQGAAAYIGTYGIGTFTITHSSGKQGGVFRYAVLGG